MKKYFLLILISFSSFAQVGINNTNPQSTLDISASSVSLPTPTDGILIPRVSNFPITNPTANQQGMLVFLTTNSTFSTIFKPKGFYYWNFPTLDWIGVTSTESEKTSLDINVSNFEDFIFDQYSGAAGPTTAGKNDNQYSFTPATNGSILSNSDVDGTSSLFLAFSNNFAGNDYAGIHRINAGSAIIWKSCAGFIRFCK
jgi:hypothetical protein